jgi:hypothetical protein
MTDQDLATLVREHVRLTEPPFLLSPASAVALGRRTLVRRRSRRGAACVLVVGAVIAVALPFLNDPSHHLGGRTGIDPATTASLREYDAQEMPTLLDEHVRRVLERSVPALGPVAFTAGDSQGKKVPARYYGKASSMEVAYGGHTGHRFRVTLLHARSEAEGDARKNCASDLAAGYYYTCQVTTTANGDVVTTRVMAVRPLNEPQDAWGALTREEVATGTLAKGDPSQDPIDRSKIYFARTVKSVHSRTFLTTAEETVRAASLTAAGKAWQVPVPDLVELATDPQLVIPRPPIGPNGCAWTLPGSHIACQ